MSERSRKKPAAVRLVDLGQPIEPLGDLRDYDSVRVFVCRDGRLLGSVVLPHQGQPVSSARLRQAIAEQLAHRLLDLRPAPSGESLVERALAAPDQQGRISHPADGCAPPARLGDDVPVSIVVATRDRPEDLRGCLGGLVAQATRRPVEIVVVDNNPASGRTPPVVAEFPAVRLVSEPRTGLSYARNAGIAASAGAVVISTDDDVLVPPDWLEKLVAPLARADVMVVTGNVLPLELETRAQSLFELYGGLGRGFERQEYAEGWFRRYRRRAVPTWHIGATANAAFRAAIFADPEIGMLDEALGAGTPTGCSEDTDLFYRVLKAGHTIVYEPDAFLWHRHRRDMRALRRQIYSYSKGHVAYHLATFFRDHDWRALYRIAVELPRAHLWQLKRRLKRRSDYPMHMIAIEVLGNLAGPLALWRSKRMVRRAGRSEPYIPPALRHRAVVPDMSFAASERDLVDLAARASDAVQS